MLPKIFFILGLAGLIARGQSGDKPGEIQESLVSAAQIPPAPVLTPDQALKSFTLAPGFRIELVASEPLVLDPVAIEFDLQGRIWVLEMQGFMRDANGTGESEPVGTVSMLEDTDQDGRIDRRTVVISNLVMPRSILLVRDGLLVAEPPHLWFYPIAKGKAGERIEVAADYAKEADPKLGAKANPEHAANSLFWAMDNWIYSANSTTRFRQIEGEWKREPTAFRGQWGMSQDNFGRLVYNSNSDQLRIDLVPPRYLSRNPNYRAAAGANVDPVRNQDVWPIRVTPGINRGYQPNMLRNGKLAQFTAACAPVIYRGDLFSRGFAGNAFVCEPSANLVKRNILIERDGLFEGFHAYTNAEFLASSDERFRPLNACNGPDGALYIVDMYHGIIQHRYFLTSYLRKQSESRGLDKSGGTGRIYRIVPDSAKKRVTPPADSSADLIQLLSHANGWWRDIAQRQLVMRNEAVTAAPLQKLATSEKNPLTRLHALWTLEGMNRLDWPTIRKAILDIDPKVKSAAIRLSEPFLKGEDRDEVLGQLVKQSGDTRHDVQLQLALTLGEVVDPKAEEAMLAIANRAATNVYIRDALLSGLGNRELEVIERIVSGPRFSQALEGFLSGLSRCVIAQRKTNRVERLLDFAARTEPRRQKAILGGMASAAVATGKGRTAAPVKLIYFAAEPESFKRLSKQADPATNELLGKITSLMTWPGQPGYVAPPPITPLTREQQQAFELGKSLFSSSCAACHQPTGFGQEGLAPPLVDSEWVLGSPERLARIALHGVRGLISVRGKTYDMEMPGLPIFDDEQIAAILTYIRREWEHTASPVPTETVRKVRTAHAQREQAWTEQDLLKEK